MHKKVAVVGVCNMGVSFSFIHTYPLRGSRRKQYSNRAAQRDHRAYFRGGLRAEAKEKEGRGTEKKKKKNPEKTVRLGVSSHGPPQTEHFRYSQFPGTSLEHYYLVRRVEACGKNNNLIACPRTSLPYEIKYEVLVLRAP